MSQRPNKIYNLDLLLIKRKLAKILRPSFKPRCEIALVLLFDVSDGNINHKTARAFLSAYMILGLSHLSAPILKKDHSDANLM